MATSTNIGTQIRQFFSLQSKQYNAKAAAFSRPRASSTLLITPPLNDPSTYLMYLVTDTVRRKVWKG